MARYPRLVIRLLGPLFLLILLLCGGVPIRTATAQMPIPSVVIDVEGIMVSLAPVDADAFQRRLNQPPPLAGPPPASVPSYTVTTAYWDAAVRETDAEPDVELEGAYFPVGGFVRARQDGQDVWLVIDVRQRATLDRYIRFGAEVGRAGPRPGALEILLFASRTEVIGIEAGAGRFSEDEVRSFWDAVVSVVADPTFRDPPRPPETAGVAGYWLTFSLPEGRSLQYFVDTAGGFLTDALGTETYDVSGLIGGVLPATAETLQIEDEDPAGSQLWWLLAVGGGVSLLGLAFALRVRQPR